MMVQFDVKRVSKGTESFMVSFDLVRTPITQVADYIIIAAAQNNSSDIHFDPREEGMMVRFRIDGDLQDYTFIPKAYERNLTTRLKLLANMNITESRLPQDGAIKGNFGEIYLDMRVSCLPVNEGEKVVIRILDYTRSLQGIETLGFNPKNLDKLKRMMNTPNGIILVTGATGSGKSTTTYSILQELNKPETNIITVEDPIEMNIQGINQVQVNSEIGMTFAAALRSILRQDPNIILIGEIRDSETAQIAVRASITGHLVLSTIHTNNSLSTIERLLDMDVERYLLSTALTGIISQRLAKQLCMDCRHQRETTKYEKKIFKKFMNKDVATIWDANPKGCEHCRKGYKGRIAIQEVLELDDDIRTALNNEKLEKEDLINMVYTGKTITMLQDALGKALEGLTSFDEVYRIIEIENDDDNYENITQVISETQNEEKTNYETTTNQSQQNSVQLPITDNLPQKQIEQPLSTEILELPFIKVESKDEFIKPSTSPLIEKSKVPLVAFVEPEEKTPLVSTATPQENIIAEEIKEETPLISTPELQENTNEEVKENETEEETTLIETENNKNEEEEVKIPLISIANEVPKDEIKLPSISITEPQEENNVVESLLLTEEPNIEKAEDYIKEIPLNNNIITKLDETKEQEELPINSEEIENKKKEEVSIEQNEETENINPELNENISEEQPQQVQESTIIQTEQKEKKQTEKLPEILLEPGIKIVPPDEEEFNSLDFSLKVLEEKEKQKEKEKKQQKEEHKKKISDSKDTDFIPSSKLNDDPILPNV